MASAKHNIITRVRGQSSPAGTRGRACGQRVREAKPPEAENLSTIACPAKAENCILICILQTPKLPGICDTSLKPEGIVRNGEQHYVSAEYQFGVVLHVVCKVN